MPGGGKDEDDEPADDAVVQVDVAGCGSCFTFVVGMQL